MISLGNAFLYSGLYLLLNVYDLVPVTSDR